MKWIFIPIIVNIGKESPYLYSALLNAAVSDEPYPQNVTMHGTQYHLTQLEVRRLLGRIAREG